MKQEIIKEEQENKSEKKTQVSRVNGLRRCFRVLWDRLEESLCVCAVL